MVVSTTIHLLNLNLHFDAVAIFLGCFTVLVEFSDRQLILSSVIKFKTAKADRSLTQSACNPIVLYRTQLIGSCSISTVANELSAQLSNTWLVEPSTTLH